MKQFLLFKNDAEIFRWGPIPGRYFYISEFEDAIFKEYINFYTGTRWPNTLILFKDKRVVWINDFNELRQAGKDIFLEYMMPKITRGKLKGQWLKVVKKLSDFEKKITDLYLEDLTDGELYNLWQEFYKLIIAFWLPTIPAELGNYGSDKLLEEKLRKYVKDDSELATAMEILTAPEKLSFYQKEEIDLSRTKDLEKHARKYFWLRNSYSGVKELTVDFFGQRKKELLINVKNLMEERLIGVKNKKRKIIQKYKLPKEVKEIAKALCEGVEWQDDRKKYIFIYTYYKELFLKEVARRFNYDIDLLRNCSSRENMQILEKRGAHTLIENRANLFGFFLSPLKKELISEEAAFCWETYSEEKVNKNIVEIKGIIASVGKDKLVRGKARIIYNPNEANGFESGNILIATMTSPEYIFLMRKSKAIITDAGGLTSHAAIVSRELNIPCIVGTKIATQVLKDGDMVEVDADKGVVKILKKQ